MKRSFCILSVLLLVLCCQCGTAALPEGEQVLENSRIRLGFQAGELRSAVFDGAGLLRGMKNFTYLYPNAQEEPAQAVSSVKKIRDGQQILTVRKENSFFEVTETYSLPADSLRLKVNLGLRIRKPMTIGVLQLAQLRGSFSMDAILHSEEGELCIADTSATIDNAARSDDFYHGFYDTAAKKGLLMLIPGNRESRDSTFFTSRNMPGRFEMGFELKQGPFGQLCKVVKGDHLSLNYEMLFVGKDPAKELNALFPGASVKPKRKTGLDGDVRMFLDPAMYRDDYQMNLLGDFCNPLSMLFYRAKKSSPATTGLKLRLELPEEVRLEKTVIFHMWIPRKIQSNPPCEIAVRKGRGVRIYTLDAPEKITSLGDKDLFDSHRQHQLYLYLRPDDVSAPVKFEWSCQLIKDGCPDGEIYRHPGEILPWKRGKKIVPRKVEMWFAQTPMRQLVWADEKQLADFIEFFHYIGIDALDMPETLPYMKNTFPDLVQRLRKAGFKIHAPYGFLRREAEMNLRNPVPGSVWTTLNGKAMYKGNNPQHSFCPSYLLREDTPLHQRLKTNFAGLDADYMWNDWEGKTFQGCYCPVCRRAFAEFAKLPEEEIQKMSPVELIRKHTLAWIRFRHHQSALMFAMFRKMANAGGRKVRMGMDYVYVDYDTEFEGVGRGRALFCEDPRMMQEAQFDFVIPDALWSGLMAYKQVETSVSQTDMRVMPKTGSVGGLGFVTGCWVSRKLMAEHQHRPLGLQDWPGLARISALGYIACGAKGLVLEGAPFDARLCLEYIRLAGELAAVEDDYFDGRDLTEKSSFYDCSGKLKPAPIDKSIGMQWVNVGGRLADLWKTRVHQRDKAFLFTMISFDPARIRSVRAVLPKKAQAAISGEMVLYDPVSLEGVLSPAGKQSWTKEEIQKGIALQCRPMDSMLLRLAPAGSVRPKKFRPALRLETQGILRRKPVLNHARLEDTVEGEISAFPFGGL